MKQAALIAATSILFTGSLLATVLVDDPFTDGSRSNTTGGDALGAVWWQSTTAAGAVTIVDDSAGIGSGSAMQLVPTTDFYKLLAFFPAATLAAEGDTLRVTFDYRFPTAPASAGDGFRIGLGNSASTRQASDTSGSTRSDDKNYGFNTNPGSTGSTSTGVKYEDAGDDILGGSGTGSRFGFGTSGGSVASGTAKHSALLQITRLANGDLTVQAQVDSLTRASGTHAAASVLTYTFDEFALGFGGTGYRPTIIVDNVLVQSTGMSVLNIAATDASGSEIGLDPATFTVTRSGTSGTLSVPYAVSGTATAGTDYVTLTGTAEFADGQASATITVAPREDWFVEGNETVIVTLTQPAGTLLQSSSATATIADNAAQTIPSDATFFAALDLTQPGLSAVRAAVNASDYATAKSNLAAYFRARTTPVFPLTSFTPNTTTINNALQHKYTLVGVTYDFEPEPVTTINWSFNPTSPVNNEWTWQFNRHDWWDDLAQSYVNNPGANAAHLTELLFELNDWITTSPAPTSSSNNTAGSRWRTIETGIRTLGAWPGCFYRIKSAPALSDDLLVLWVKSFYMHAKHLQSYTAGSGNWVAIEQRGLFTIGTIFPEFSEAASWRSLAITRLENLLNSDVYADGAEVELSPGYHDNVINDIEGVKSLASANGLPTSPVFDAKLEGLYAYELWATEPNRKIPIINDSWNPDVKTRLGKGFASFPARTDFQWIATAGVSGTVPAHTSHLFADAGQAVMRSGWGTGDSYLLMDAGPYGSGHQHEDKLSLNIDGYGMRHIIDCGPYDYDTSAYRTMSLGSHANSQPLIDDLDQNRAADSTLRRNATPIAWRTSSLYDYAAASYGEDTREGWGPSRVRPAITRRHVFFLKPDAWVVIDAFTALDASAHTYTGVFHCSDANVGTDAATQRVTVQLLPGEFDPYSRTTVSTAKPSLTITPLLAGGQTLQVIKGQDSPPIFGYQFDKDTTWKKQAIPSARYDRTATGDTQMAYALAAAPAASAPRTPTITQATTAAGTYGVTVSFGNPNDAQTFLIGLDGANTTWNGTAYAAPALVASATGVYAWDATKPIDAWKFAYFGTANPLAADLADGDSDGLCTLLEYVLATNPTVRSANPVLTGLANNGALTLTYRRERPSGEIEYRVEVSGDLVNWEFGPDYVSEVLQPDGVTSIATDLTVGGKRFIRLRAVRAQ